MQELLPLQIICPFKCSIIASKLITKLTNTTFYNCITNFGNMTLIVEEIHHQKIQSHSKQISNRQNHISTNKSSTLKENLQKRNLFLASYPFSTYIPVIYQQYIVISHKEKFTCLTLIEPVQILTFNDCKQLIKLQIQRNLILSLFQSEKNQFSFGLNQQNLEKIIFLKSMFSNRFHFDFTKLTQSKQIQKEAIYKSKIINNFLKQFYFIEKQKAQNIDQFKQIILIKDHVYKFSRSKLVNKNFKSWFEIAICFNFLIDQEVYIQVKQKNMTQQISQRMKKICLKNLSSISNNNEISFYQSENLQKCSKLHFYDEYCIDLLQKMQYEQLLKDFFVDNSIYLLNKTTYLQIQRLDNLYVFERKQKGDTIYIEQGVVKSQCINFFITYCKFVEPTLKKISFAKEQNKLIFQFLGKFKVQRKLCLIFHPNYIIKDEQLSMIIEKSKLQNTAIQLSQMCITDSFLMFLANSQKMSKVKKLDISYCKKVTQNGVNSLLISPFCKNLEILQVSGTPVIQSSIQSLFSKTQLKELYINNCIKSEDSYEEQFILKNIKLTKFQALGMRISPIFSANIQYLKIDFQLPLDFLKELKDMPLKQLKVNLVQQKKNIIGGFLGSIGNFYTKQVNPIKSFAQGRSNKTLKLIDLSGSTAKLKNLKLLFAMSQIEIVKLQNLTNSQQIDFHIGSKILQLSIQDSSICIRDLWILLKHTKILMKLNVSSSLIKKQELQQFLFQSKKFINTLVISEGQYSSNLIDPNGKSSDYVETYQLLCSEAFFKIKNQNLIAIMILKTINGNKNLRFIQKTHNIKTQISKIRRFQNIVLKTLSKIITNDKIDSIKNIFINEKTYKITIKDNSYRKTIDQKINCEQFIRIHKKSKKVNKYYLSYQICSYFKSNLMLKINHKQNISDLINEPQISYLTYLYKKTVLQNPDQLIQVSLQHSKLIDCQNALKMINEYNLQKKINILDFRGATLKNTNLLLHAAQLPYLQSFNHNQYQVQFDEYDFVNLSQKYLKFFMKIVCIKKFKFTCKNIKQIDILFSILFHILDSHYQTVEQLDCSFQNLRINSQNSTSFWIKITQLKKLTSLQLKFQNCSTYFLRKIFQTHQLNKHKQLQTLIIQGIHIDSLSNSVNGTSIKNLNLNVQNSKINETHLIKFLRIFGNGIKNLSLNLNQCDLILSPNRLFSAISSFINIQKLSIQMQYCPLKQLSTLDFLQNIYSLKQLRQVQIDLSYTSIHYDLISNIIVSFPNKLPNCHFLIYLIGNQSKQIIFDKQGLQNQGVQIVI